MQTNLYSIHDSKAEAFMTPFFAPTAGVALRMLESSVQDENHEFHKYAADYTLFEIGRFDHDTGELIAHASPVSLGLALQFKTNPIALAK